MGGLFSRKEQPRKANRITEQDKAILVKSTHIDISALDKNQA